MSNDTISNDEKSSSSGLGKLESLSQEELIKIIKNQFLLKKKFEAKINELTNSNINFTQIEQELRQEIEQNKINELKRQEEFNNLQNELSIVRSSLINESQKSSSHSEILTNTILTIIDSFQLSLSLPDSIDNEFMNVFKNELEQKQENFKQLFEQFEQEKLNLQQRIEDLEFFNEEIKLENDDLRLKSKNYQHDKQSMEKEIDNYRRQIEDFEEQFLELQRESYHDNLQRFDKSQQQPSQTSSLLTLHQFDENYDEISLQCINSILDQINDNNQCISKASSTSSLLLSSDIPTLLHSIGITNCTDEDFSIPLNFESVLRLSTLLIERCRVLQYILLKNNDCINFSQNDQFEQCKILIHKHDHFILDTIFERIYTGMNQTINSNDFHILIEKPIYQKTSSSVRLEFDNFKFVSDEFERDLIRLRFQYEELSKENSQQRNEISLLEKRLYSNNSYEQLKLHQTQLEEQLMKQCEKTIQLENILQEANIDKSKLDQLKQIEISYNELKEKYHIAQTLEEQLKELNKKYNEKILELKQQNDLFEKLKIDYEKQHSYLLERNETIRLLELELNEDEELKKNLMKQFEQQKLNLLNATHNQDQHFSLISQQQDELNEQIQKKIFENKILFEKNLQLENQFEENKKILYEKNQQIKKLEKQIQTNEEMQKNFNQINEENIKFTNEINILMNKITILENEKLQSSPNNNNQEENDKLHQTINQLNDKMDRQNSDSNENIQDLKEKYQKMKLLLTRLKKELQDKNHQPKQSLIDLELADYEKTTVNLKQDLLNKDKDIQDLRDELFNSTQKYDCLKLEIENLEKQKLQNEERANKFKALLDLAKKELQHAKELELQRYENDDHIRNLIETLQKQLDSNKILINELLNEKQQLTEKLNNQNEISQKTINLYEQNLRIAKHDLDIAKQDYDTLQDDFNSYKIRAQSVLKQHQTNQRERTPSLADKNLELEQTIEKFQKTLQEANDKIQLLITENQALQTEQGHLTEIQVKLINESRKREQDLRKQHHIEMNKIENDYLQQINDNQDIIKNLTLQNETMSIAFKEQIATIELEHKQAITNLQEQLQISEQEIEQLKIRLQSNLNNENSTSISDTSKIGIKSDFNRDNTLAWNVYEHQQGEDSTSGNIESQSTDIPINIIENVQANNKSNHISIENNEFDRQSNENELKQMKLFLMNTKELLNESELNNQRLNEQVTLLKDEIRRIERNMDRAESISNLEYLKNVILKFFILKSTPERLQLIPVLVTMLKLTSDEQVQLVRVANIPIINDENSRSDESPPSQQIINGATSPSWSSYLNMW